MPAIAPAEGLLGYYWTPPQPVALKEVSSQLQEDVAKRPDRGDFSFFTCELFESEDSYPLGIVEIAKGDGVVGGAFPQSEWNGSEMLEWVDRVWGPCADPDPNDLNPDNMEETVRPVIEAFIDHGVL